MYSLGVELIQTFADEKLLLVNGTAGEKGTSSFIIGYSSHWLHQTI